MKLHRILITLISALLLASTLIHAEEPEVTPEIVWKSFTTVGSMTLELPENYFSKWQEDLSNENHIKKGEMLLPPDEKGLSVFPLYSVPKEPGSIKNFRFKYDFRADESVEAFTSEYKKEFPQYFNTLSAWAPPVVQKINGTSVLLLRGRAVDRNGQTLLFHDHYIWSKASTSELFTLNFIYLADSPEIQENIKKILPTVTIPE